VLLLDDEEDDVLLLLLDEEEDVLLLLLLLDEEEDALLLELLLVPAPPAPPAPLLELLLAPPLPLALVELVEPPPSQLSPHTLSTIATHALSHCSLQQWGSAAQMLLMHGWQLLLSFAPSWQISCSQRGAARACWLDIGSSPASWQAAASRQERRIGERTLVRGMVCFMPSRQVQGGSSNNLPLSRRSG
jgi:hypothetical protein